MLKQEVRKALGSEAILTIVAPTVVLCDQILTEIWEQIEDFEARFSRFRLDSELTFVNHQSGTETPITKPFFELLIKSKEMSEKTEGLYNPFILPALQQAGYVGSWPNPSQGDPKLNYQKRKIQTIEKLVINKTSVHIPKRSALDFGGIGKGYLLEKLAKYCLSKCEGFWFSLGGDIICGGVDDAGNDWELGIQSAHQPNQIVASVNNKDGSTIALATSGITKRRGEKNGTTWHHLIDPRSGLPTTTDVATVSVVSDSATNADVFASCAVLLGIKEGKTFLTTKASSGLFQGVIGTNHSESVDIVGKAFVLSSPQSVKATHGSNIRR